MSKNITTLGDWVVESPRTRRARTEPMTIALKRTGGVYEVRVASGRRYDVDVSIPACTCPDWQERKPEGGCKHLRRVEMEIVAGRVSGPDGQLPQRTPGAMDGTLEPTPLITGPHTEYGPDGVPTGGVYYRCIECRREARHREAIHNPGECGREPRDDENRG